MLTNLEDKVEVKVAATGHRPPKIGGYDEWNPIRMHIRKIMVKDLLELKAKFALEGRMLVGISGMALGIDQDFARACCTAEVPFDAYIPFEGQHLAWPNASQKTYKNLLEKARFIVNTEFRLPDPVEHNYEGVCYLMDWRNKCMVDDSTKVLAFYDGSDGGTGNCVAYAKEIKRDMKIYDPIKEYELVRV